MIPRASFEGVNLNLQNGCDYLPLIFTMGRFYEENGRVLLPLAVQVHHAVCAGFHRRRSLPGMMRCCTRAAKNFQDTTQRTGSPR